MATTGEDTLSETNMSIISNTTMSTHEYDGRGAMLFTVATVLVYGMSIVAFIAGHLRRRHHTKEEESQISKYLKRTDDIRRQAVREDVLRLRSQLLASSVIITNQNPERRKSRVERAKQLILNDVNCVSLEGSPSPSTESIILPACTVSPPKSEEEMVPASGAVQKQPLSNCAKDAVFFVQDTEEGDSVHDSTRNDNFPDSGQFIKIHRTGLPRLSLCASLDQSVMNDQAERPVEGRGNTSPEGSPDFNKSRKYRSRRRGGNQNTHLILSQGPQG